MRLRAFVLCVLLALPTALRADGPGDNIPDKVRRIPPLPPANVKVSDADRQDLQAGVDALGKEIDGLRTALKGKPQLLELLPDVQVYHKAVDWALRYNEIYKNEEVKTARTLLKEGQERAKELRDGKAPWTTATGLVVRGYVSKIDGSVQPYGLVVPASYQPNTPYKHRLDVWCHGRGETLTELSFIEGREKSAGDFTPPNAFVLHLYGRYCCANRFAGGRHVLRRCRCQGRDEAAVAVDERDRDAVAGQRLEGLRRDLHAAEDHHLPDGVQRYALQLLAVLVHD